MFPFDTKFTSARFDEKGGLWVASSNDVWRMRFDSTTSVMSDNVNDRPCFVSVPNPASSTVTILDQEKEPAFGMFIVRDAGGSIVHTSAGPLINPLNHATGVYFLSSKEYLDCCPVKIVTQ